MSTLNLQFSTYELKITFESNQTESNQTESNQTESNPIKSILICHVEFYTYFFRNAFAYNVAYCGWNFLTINNTKKRSIQFVLNFL